MKRIEHPADLSDRKVTYELSDGTFIRFDQDMISKYGVEELLRYMGKEHLISKERIDVFQHGKKIGTVPASFDPRSIKQTSFFHDPRPDDFVFEHGKWFASRTLGPGDLDATPGFEWVRK